jgi:malonate transporter
MAAIMMAAMPIMGIYPTLTQADGLEEFSAAALLASTVASFFTLSALLAVMKWAV